MKPQLGAARRWLAEQLHYARTSTIPPEVRKLGRDAITNADRSEDRGVARRLSRQTESQSPGRIRALFVISTTVGGTPHTNQDLMTALAGPVETFVLRSDSRSVELSRWSEGRCQVIQTARLAESIQPFPHSSSEYNEIVAGWLLHFRIDLVHIRHLVWHGIDLPRIAKSLGIPVVLSFHDYYAVCPTIRLLDENSRFCGGECTHTPGDCKIELWRGKRFPRLKNAAVHDWRIAMAGALEHCDAFVTTTASTRELVGRFFPVAAKRPFMVIEHGRDFGVFGSLGQFPHADETVRVLAPGNLSVAKGAGIIAAMQDLASDRPFEFHVLGRSRELKGKRNVVLHGEYDRGDFQRLAAKIAPHFGVVLSIWAETWCHTLTELWAAGLPVAAYDIGAVRHRLRMHGGGWLLTDSSPRGTLAGLLGIVADEDGFSKRLAEVRAWQCGEGRDNTSTRMARSYLELYRRLVPSVELAPLS